MSLNYFKLDEDVRVPGRWFLGDFRSTDFGDRQRLQKREPCKGTFTVDPGDGGRAMNFSFTAFGLPIASLTVAETIAEIAGNDVHLVPVYIKGYGDFKFIQCLRELDCVDEARSDFEKYEDDAPNPTRRGDYASFTKLIVDPSRIPTDAHIFHISKWYVRPIVSGRTRDALVAAGDLAVKFVTAVS